ncbi:1-acyl-sn-glycerol-3-phosphate acyltransferase [Pengzhenrongella sicca]|uniref:1-acyl-sn-glycerol-3-phosphate acyltransferase n=1 Tax=Pengzhenrongella sicca TaxID=2819238 RepID=A0A8A4ZG25_9MICO|nr:1-acyl-sn-glycerol-3-phosphate acyltransferase [Pengzhenrongella sicca]QTE29476.1 1-acyl-sn-glycerol-3-phosphate acyltransferase [Pengzhenrongella sicca]
MIRRSAARVFWSVSRWTLKSEPVPPESASILIGAPHTSNWDFLFMLAITWDAGISARFLGKKSLFRGPLGPIMRWLGGIPVDRSHPMGLVHAVVERARASERFFLVVTPEGTRARTAGWKSGFYRIALDTGLPITLGYVDRTTMTTGLGPTFHLTGDVAADMDRIRAFYADKSGFSPENRTEPRLRDETKPPRLA